MEDLYAGKLLDAAAAIPPKGEPGRAPFSATRSSRVCGSIVTVGLTFNRAGQVEDIVLDVEACALGQASSSLLAKSIRGATPKEIKTLRDEMQAMLKEDGPAPRGARWAEMATLEPIRGYPARHASTLLVFEAAADCAEQWEASQ